MNTPDSPTDIWSFNRGPISIAPGSAFSIALLLMTWISLIGVDAHGQGSATAAKPADQQKDVEAPRAAPSLAAGREPGGLASPANATNSGSAHESGSGGVAASAPSAAGKKEIKLPGIVVNREERCVDIESSVCLRDGMIELIACTKDTKEHESIVVVEARPALVHAALLLLGAKAGNPAMRRLVDENTGRWVDFPPAGSPVDVFLVFQDKQGKKVERPISDFIVSGPDPSAFQSDEEKAEKFPTNTFLFTGSIFIKDSEGKGQYIGDDSGDLISVVTFGDEVLGLSEVHSSDNGELMWHIDGNSDLPAVGSKVTLRLRPKKEPMPAAE